MGVSAKFLGVTSGKYGSTFPMPSCFVPIPLYILNPLCYELKIVQAIITSFGDFKNVKMDEISFACLP